MKIKELINFKTFSYNWERIESIPEFKKLKNCEQNPKWHSEGNAWNHTKLVCEAAANICRERHWENEEGYSSLLLTSALFHDIGKIVTTHKGKDGNWHAYGHESEGEKITRRILWDCEEFGGYVFREKICSLVKYHMMPLQIFESKTIFEKIVEISREVPSWYILIQLKKCDVIGSLQEDTVSKNSDFIKLETLEHITERMGCNYYPFPHDINEYKKYIDEVKKPSAKVFVMIGLPGSGKSTIAEKTKPINGGVIVSRDEIRYELGYCEKGEKVVLNKHKENEVTEEFEKRVLNAAKKGVPIILDNMNTKRKYRDSYKSLLSNYNVDWNYIYVEAPTLGDNLERRMGQIEKGTFIQMINDIEMPTHDEYDNISYIKTYEQD
jgi:putative nucleotidyltransferase with HDIG domain